MSDSLERIEQEFEEFGSLVEHCRDEANSDMGDIKDAYERFYRLYERYDHEDKAGTLSPTERPALPARSLHKNFAWYHGQRCE